MFDERRVVERLGKEISHQRRRRHEDELYDSLSESTNARHAQSIDQECRWTFATRLFSAILDVRVCRADGVQ